MHWTLDLYYKQPTIDLRQYRGQLYISVVVVAANGYVYNSTYKSMVFMSTLFMRGNKVARSATNDTVI